MSKKANPTEAKTIALYFLDMTTDGRNTPATIAKTIKQVKNLQKVGFTKDEIIATIDYVLAKGIRMHSFGYINTCIENVLQELNKSKVDDAVVKAKEELQQLMEEARGEVNVVDESTERNRAKLARFQSGKREKHYLDMFEGHGQDN